VIVLHVVQKIMTGKATIRFDDGQLFVAVTQEVFEQRIRTLLDNAELPDVDEQCDTIVYCRGELPPTTSIWRERFFWLISVIVIMSSIYGLVCFFDDMIKLLG